MTNLFVYSIFNSISGEIGGIRQGSLVTFIRLAGCNLRCSYCDTSKTWEKSAGILMSIEQICEQVDNFNCPNVLITGGEPLEQESEILELAYELKYGTSSSIISVSVETNGSYKIPNTKIVDHWIVDYKLGSSGMNNAMSDSIIKELSEFSFGDNVLKFVCSNREDFDEAVTLMTRLGMINNPPSKWGGVTVAFSPIIGKLIPVDLVLWMQEKKLDAVFSLQIHKFIWPNGEKGDIK